MGLWMPHKLFLTLRSLIGRIPLTDFAKQIFTTLATVFVSVVSFYFGSSVTTSAAAAGARAAQGSDGDKKSAALQSTLTSALADSHTAQITFGEATANLKQLTDSQAAPADIEAAKAALTTATDDLKTKQAKVQAAQDALNALKTSNPTPATQS